MTYTFDYDSKNNKLYIHQQLLNSSCGICLHINKNELQQILDKLAKEINE